MPPIQQHILDEALDLFIKQGYKKHLCQIYPYANCIYTNELPSTVVIQTNFVQTLG